MIRRSKLPPSVSETKKIREVPDYIDYTEISGDKKYFSEYAHVNERLTIDVKAQSTSVPQMYKSNDEEDALAVSIPVKHVLTPTSWNIFATIKENDELSSSEKHSSSDRNFEVRHDDYMSGSTFPKEIDTRMDWKEFTHDPVTKHIIEISLSQRCESDEVEDDDLGSVVDDEEGVEVVDFDENQSQYCNIGSEGHISCVPENEIQQCQSNLSCVYQSSEKKFITFLHKT